MPGKKALSRFICLVITFSLLSACAHRKTPVILDLPPKDQSYEVIAPIETLVEWHGLHWLWYWWHYMPWYSSIYKTHDKKLIKKAKKLGADAIINVEYLPHRQGAKAEAIRFVEKEEEKIE